MFEIEAFEAKMCLMLNELINEAMKIEVRCVYVCVVSEHTLIRIVLSQIVS